MRPTVFLVDDDAAVRGALSQLLAAHDFAVRTFASAEAFLAAFRPDDTGCLLLDLRLPGMTGIELQATLAARGVTLPIIFLTGYGDVPTSVHALKSGAVDFLEKPASTGALLERVRSALALGVERKVTDDGAARARERLEALTPREHEVMSLAISGLSNKQIGRQLGISHRTVELHRARVMRKSGASTLIELADFARAAGIESEPTGPPRQPDTG